MFFVYNIDLENFIQIKLITSDLIMKNIDKKFKIRLNNLIQ
jgi:hypothetical protein